MGLADLKRKIQDHFTDGLLIVVGSGLSSAEGVPGMAALAMHLLATVRPQLPEASAPAWNQIESDIKAGTDLESALHRSQPDSGLEALILQLTADFIAKAEAQVIHEVLAGQRVLRFSRLLKHLLKPNSGIPVVTTNYDRLIEVATEAAGLGVDSLFVGQHLGRFDPRESRFSLCRKVMQRRKVVHLTYADHVVLLKPHGSLDWFMRDGEPIRLSLSIVGQRLMITPGVNKFRGGYDRPFDAHRERANQEIDRASRYLIVGYGFNDDHLQTHLEHQLRKGVPTIVLARSLSAKARQLVQDCNEILALSEDAGGTGTQVLQGRSEITIPDCQLWDIGKLIDEVLEP